MAEVNLIGVITMEENIVDGHIVSFKFHVHRLDFMQRTFYPLLYCTLCPTIKTMWEIELKYERVSHDNDSYTFSITLKRKDSSSHLVKASLFATFYDAHGNSPVCPIASDRGKMVLDDELQGTLDNIRSAELSEVVAVRITIIIENCHSGTFFF
ncbi:unnamed protein product [Larinioides sclopetarius]|uniref:MATH domain-containing protein n=1 Tax=Larinioides sclopetarius TaxID=280406 RepID=A0AAV2BYL9_9ARAC